MMPMKASCDRLRFRFGRALALVAIALVAPSCLGPDARFESMSAYAHARTPADLPFPLRSDWTAPLDARPDPSRSFDPPRDTADAVVLVTIDGVRAEEAFSPMVMPRLRELIETRGAALGLSGFGNVVASGPNFVSLPGYTEIFTGRPIRGDYSLHRKVASERRSNALAPGDASGGLGLE